MVVVIKPRVDDDRLAQQAVCEFLLDLSILVRRDAAPCPWCGGEARVSGGYTDYPEVSCRCDGHHRAGLVVAGPLEECVRAWNEVAIPAAARRLLMEET